MIDILNPSKKTRFPFFKDVVNYLDQHPGSLLREIKQAFPDVKVDKYLEEYIAAGWIRREDRRYQQRLPLMTSLDGLELDQEVFIDVDGPLYPDLQSLRFATSLANDTNDLVIQEETDFQRESLTLSNFFYKMRHQYPLSSEQMPLYEILGDVNAAYALKYMTTFLLKFARKERVIQKRRDIFVDAMVVLGWIEPLDEVGYALRMQFDREDLILTYRP